MRRSRAATPRSRPNSAGRTMRTHDNEPFVLSRDGKDVVKAPELPPDSTEDDVLKLAWDQLRTCYDPEIPINIVDLGLIYECTVSAQPDARRVISVRLTLTAP